MTLKRNLGIALAFSGLVGTTLAADIRFDGFPDYDSQLKAILGGFPDHNVELLMNEHGAHHDKLKTNLATGRGAGDVVLVDRGFVGSFINSGGFVDLTERFAPYKDNFVEYAVAQGQGADGRQYAVPIDLGPGVMYYRRDYMEEKGYDVDDVINDWDSYLDYGRELKKDGILLIGDAIAVATAYWNFNVEPGNGLFFDAEGKPLVTGPRFRRAFELAKTVHDEGMDGDISEWTEEWYIGFREGRFATQLSGAWLLGHLQNWIAPETSGNWGVSNLPDGIYGSWGGSFLAIPKQSEHQQAAWELVEYMISEDIQRAGFANIAAFPAHTGTYDDPVFDEPIEFLGGQQARLLFADIAQHIEPVQTHAGDQIAESLVMTALEQVLDDGVDIDTALANAERQIRRRVR